MNDTKSLIKTLTQIAMAVLLVIAIPAAQAAKGGGVKISVTAASPAEALQGEELDVIVSGSGFDEGTTAIYLVTGTSDETQIEVISTEFVDANQLKTRIRVKGGATIIDYDIQATNSRGRRGKGTTLFSVKQSSGGGGGVNPNLGDDYTATDGVTFISPSDVGSFDYHIIGTPARDEIYAGGGKDLIEGGGEHDEVWARGGDDEIHVVGGKVSGGTGDDIIIVGDYSYDLWGDEGDDILIGGDGGGGINGGEGTDWLEGGDSDDWISFSLGSLIALPDQYDVDHYDGKLGQNHLIFWDEEGTVESVFVDLALGIYEANARDSFGTLVTVSGAFFNFENIEGTTGDDVLLGDDASNNLGSRNGDNIIYGFGGNDLLNTGGEGNNIVYGGSGNDRLAANGDGNDIIFGEAGDDFLETGRGDNELHGGEGCDGYIIDRHAGGTDTIMDFEPACEKIYIGSPSRHLSIEIYDVGYDTIIDMVVRKRTIGTIILKDTVLNGVTVDESIFIYEQFPDWDCSRYWCDKYSQ